jgi:hypothetical protein
MDSANATKEGQHLDPTDWVSFSEEMHKNLDRCLERMQNAKSLPWKQPPAPAEMLASVSLLPMLEEDSEGLGTDAGAVFEHIATGEWVG